MNETPAAITKIEDAHNAKWLAATLAPARSRVAEEPTEDAVERIRARVFGETAAEPKHTRIAA